MVPKQTTRIRKQRERRMKEQKGRCYWCGGIMDEDHYFLRPTLDHLVPRSRGGTRAYENAVAACFECNQAKADRLPEEFDA